MATDRFPKLELDVGEFSVYIRDDNEAASRHYVRHHDLRAKPKKALSSGTQRAVLLLKLGLGDYDCDEARLDFQGSAREEDENAAEVLSHAIETLTVLRDQLEVLRSVPEVREQEHSAFSLGAMAQEAGNLPDGVPDFETVQARRRQRDGASTDGRMDWRGRPRRRVHTPGDAFPPALPALLRRPAPCGLLASQSQRGDSWKPEAGPWDGHFMAFRHDTE